MRIKVETDEVIRVYRLLEALNDFFHQPLNFEDKNIVMSFARKNYPEIRELYYDTSSFAPLCKPIFQGFQEMVDLENPLFGQCEIRHLHPIMTKN